MNSSTRALLSASLFFAACGGIESEEAVDIGAQLAWPPPLPKIISFTPTSGDVGMTTVVVKGESFDSMCAWARSLQPPAPCEVLVTIGPWPVAHVPSGPIANLTPTEITFVVPNDMYTGPIGFWETATRPGYNRYYVQSQANFTVNGRAPVRPDAPRSVRTNAPTPLSIGATWVDVATNEDGYVARYSDPQGNCPKGGPLYRCEVELPANSQIFYGPGLHPNWKEDVIVFPDEPYQIQIEAQNHFGQSTSSWIPVRTPPAKSDVTVNVRPVAVPGTNTAAPSTLEPWIAAGGVDWTSDVVAAVFDRNRDGIVNIGDVDEAQARAGLPAENFVFPRSVQRNLNANPPYDFLVGRRFARGSNTLIFIQLATTSDQRPQFVALFLNVTSSGAEEVLMTGGDLWAFYSAPGGPFPGTVMDSEGTFDFNLVGEAQTLPYHFYYPELLTGAMQSSLHPYIGRLRGHARAIITFSLTTVGPAHGAEVEIDFDVWLRPDDYRYAGAGLGSFVK